MPGVRYLIDAHALIWAVDDPTRLSAPALSAISDQTNTLLLGAGTIWEISIKVGIGKLTLSMPFRDWMERVIADLNLTLLPITVEHAAAVTQLPPHHCDPFDRLLVAQAQVEIVQVVCNDVQFDSYGAVRIW